MLRLTELEDVSLPVQEIDEEICKKKQQNTHPGSELTTDYCAELITCIVG